MEYNDELLPDSFEQLAKAYANNLKQKGFVFVSLQKEEFSMLVDEIMILISKMKSCLIQMQKILNASELFGVLENAQKSIQEKFNKKATHEYRCIARQNECFLCLVSLENLLTIKLMCLSIKSDEIEFCNKIIVEISSIFAKSFDIEKFLLT